MSVPSVVGAGVVYFCRSNSEPDWEWGFDFVAIPEINNDPVIIMNRDASLRVY
jgi:hypothetical protein